MYSSRDVTLIAFLTPYVKLDDYIKLEHKRNELWLEITNFAHILFGYKNIQCCFIQTIIASHLHFVRPQYALPTVLCSRSNDQLYTSKFDCTTSLNRLRCALHVDIIALNLSEPVTFARCMWPPWTRLMYVYIHWKMLQHWAGEGEFYTGGFV